MQVIPNKPEVGPRPMWFNDNLPGGVYTFECAGGGPRTLLVDKRGERVTLGSDVFQALGRDECHNCYAGDNPVVTLLPQGISIIP
jgi:hypothetical protein